MHTFQFCRHLREAPGKHTDLLKKTGNFPGKNCYKLVSFCITKIRLREISSRKNVSESNFLKIKNPTMIQLNRIQLSSQTTNHVEITKTLSTSQRENGIIEC